MRIVLQSFSFVENNAYYNLGLLYLQSALLARPRLAEQIKLSTIWAPLSSIRNPEVLPADVVGNLSADAWINVGVIRFSDGWVEARGLYRTRGTTERVEQRVR